MIFLTFHSSKSNDNEITISTRSISVLWVLVLGNVTTLLYDVVSRYLREITDVYFN